MFYINAEDAAVDSFNESCVQEKIFVFNPEQEDYFLENFYFWDCVTTEVFDVEIANRMFTIPSGTYILCGCAGGSQDWILIDEMIARPIDVFVIGKGFRGFSLSDMVLKNHRTDSFYLPAPSKNPIPITDSTASRIIITSQTDAYSRMKDKDYDIYYIS